MMELLNDNITRGVRETVVGDVIDDWTIDGIVVLTIPGVTESDSTSFENDWLGCVGVKL